MRRTLIAPALIAFLAHAAVIPEALAQQAADGGVPVEVTFMVSGGLWGDASGRKGYYRLVSVRQPDRSARVFLQKIVVAGNGEAMNAGIAEIKALSDLHGRVTDIRPEDSAGNIKGPGFFATVFVVSATTGAEPQEWTVAIDEHGDLHVGRASN